MIITCKPFEKLSTNELYKILALRAEVFIIEQSCIFQDIDFKDQKALHCMCWENEKLVAYTRIFDKDDYFEGYLSIGRVVVAASFRELKYGKEIMKFSIQTCYEKFGHHSIKIGAQTYLYRFYSDFGFKTVGQEYLEDGILHQTMIL